MKDAELELAVQRWLSADAAATYAPDALRGRILDIPSAQAVSGSWWSRFATMPAIGASVATASIAGVLIATMFFGLFDRPAGTDGETCSNRQVQQALDNLRDAAGYRYVNLRQTHQLDPDAGLSFDDPQYVWTDGSTAEGAYLAPDRVIERVTTTRGGMFDRGYLEHLQINGHTYRLMEVDGAEAWVEDTNWPTPNLVYGYIGAAFPTFSVPLVSGADWGEAAVTAELPGTGGCTAATLIPADDAVEGGFASQRAVALRVDVGSVRPTAVAIGPAEGAMPHEGDERSTWALTWETPDSSEFAEPAGALPDPNTVEQSFVPTPSPSPLEPEPGAWPATELSADVGANISDVAGGGGRLVAVGAGFPGGHAAAAIWTSTDGRSWEPVVDLPDGAGIGLNTVDWNGEIYLVVGHREVRARRGRGVHGCEAGDLDLSRWRYLGIRRRHRTRGRDRGRRESRTPRLHRQPMGCWWFDLDPGHEPAAAGILRQLGRCRMGDDRARRRRLRQSRHCRRAAGRRSAGPRLRVAGWDELRPVRRGVLPASVAIGRWHRVDARRDQRPVRGRDDPMGRPPHRHRERGRPDGTGW